MYIYKRRLWGLVPATKIGEITPPSGQGIWTRHLSQSNDAGPALLLCEAVEEYQSVHL